MGVAIGDGVSVGVGGILAMAIELRMVHPGSNPPLPNELLTEIEQEQLADLGSPFCQANRLPLVHGEDVVRATSSISWGSMRPLGDGRRDHAKAARSAW